MNMHEVREKARKILKERCRVCPICDGRACAGEVPGMGGCGTGKGFMSNVSSLARWKLHMRTLHGINDVSTSFELWGEKFTSPAMIAPMTGVEANLNGAVKEKDMAEAFVKGAKEAGILCWTGDGNISECFDAGLDALKSNKSRGIVTIKPRPDNEIISLIRRAEETNPLAIAIDIDAAGFAVGTKNPYGFETKSPEALLAIVRCTDLPIILKGVMTTGEAALAVDLGVKGIVVSNHGGRVMDDTPGTSAVLQAIAENVRGQIKIFVDGGVRTGYDVLKMLALGADAVLIGRPVIVAAAGGGHKGVALYFDEIKKDLSKAMVMTGTENLERALPKILHHALQ